MQPRALAAAVVAALLAGCASETGRPTGPIRRPADVRAQVSALMPASVADRAGWAADIVAAFSALKLEPTTERLCAVLAVTEQESTFRADPPVANLPKVAWEEIERRADRMNVPMLLVRGALALSSSDGRSYAERIDGVRTERELSEIFEDFLGRIPLGQRLFAGYNPVRTGGPMQVGIAFAQAQVKDKPYPYPMPAGVRPEVFTRRGGLYFGIAHLLDYTAPYERMIHRFADFNAGRWASRNAAFQSAVSQASGIPLVLDGDLVRPDAPEDQPGPTEVAVRALSGPLGMNERQIRRALEEAEGPGFERSGLYRRVFEIAERQEGRSLPRAVMPRIDLRSPKITRKLTTEWFARRVDERHQRCMNRAAALDG